MKRRKLKDNPYTINYSEETNIYSISFIQNSKKEIINISKILYEEFNKFELEDKSYMNKYDRHIEHSQLTENSINERMINKELSIEDTIIKNIQNENLYKAISKLPSIQNARIHKYFFDNLTLKEIAKSENCSIRAVQYSMECALNNLKKFLS